MDDLKNNVHYKHVSLVGCKGWGERLNNSHTSLGITVINTLHKCKVFVFSCGDWDRSEL